MATTGRSLLPPMLKTKPSLTSRRYFIRAFPLVFRGFGMTLYRKPMSGLLISPRVERASSSNTSSFAGPIRPPIRHRSRAKGATDSER